ncbi:hypothetical protein H0H92_002891 [Tricholoma furcatifolium]|nr:hypothetical protein H0H92_002891 [Tricholoma furcatifolium]
MEEDFLEQTKNRNFDFIVCSDGEAILGIGDQGVGGIGISTAKSVMYTLIGGVDPSRLLSVTLDVGTNNQDLLNDEQYVGWNHKRVRGEEYDRFIDKFVQLVRKYFPYSLLHFEDFGVTNAQRLLKIYRTTHCVFNDDIQGTGAVTLACVMAAVGVTKSKISDQRYIIFGAGSAGMGITQQLRDAIVQLNGLEESEANKLFYLIDKDGLVTDGVTSQLLVPPPSAKSVLVEVDPEDANEWSGGLALLATGSPFPPVTTPSGKESECNNALIYPGLGFGTVLVKSPHMTDSMIIAGARRLASLSPVVNDPDGPLLADFADAPRVNFEVAVAVAEQAIIEGMASVNWTRD